jgi:hypothetical protein
VNRGAEASLGLIGVGFGPTLTGILSDVYAHLAFHAGDLSAICPGGQARAVLDSGVMSACQAASSTGIKEAIGTMALFFLWAALHYFLAARRLVRDLDTHYEGSGG